MVLNTSLVIRPTCARAALARADRFIKMSNGFFPYPRQREHVAPLAAAAGNSELFLHNPPPAPTAPDTRPFAPPPQTIRDSNYRRCVGPDGGPFVLTRLMPAFLRRSASRRPLTGRFPTVRPVSAPFRTPGDRAPEDIAAESVST